MPAALSNIPAGVLAPVKLKCAEVIAATGDAVTHVWGYNVVPDHDNRRCIDFMVASKAAGDRVASYLWTHRARLGLELIIWYGRIIRTYPKPGIPAGTWATYTGPNPHRDHPHVQFNAAAYVAPPVVPKPSTATSKPAPAFPGWYHVDPAKVRTELLGLDSRGRVKLRRKPRANLYIGSKATRWGNTWGLTSHGTYYRLSYLRKGKA